MPKANQPPSQHPGAGGLANAAFARFDADHDGAITESELTDKLDPDGSRPALQELLDQLFQAVDEDGNEELSRDEVQDAIGQLAGPGNGPPSIGDLPFPLGLLWKALPELVPAPPPAPPAPAPEDPHRPPTVDQLVDWMFAAFDGDHDDAIALAEMLAVLDPNAAHRGFDKHVGRIFDAVDADGDEFLSRDELTAVIEALDAQQVGPRGGVPGQLHAATVQLVGLALSAEAFVDAGG